MWPLRVLPFRPLSTAAPTPNLIHRYEALLADGVLARDAAQLAALDRLQVLLQALRAYGGALREWEARRDAHAAHRAAAEPQIRAEAGAAERRRREAASGLIARLFQGPEPREEASARAAVDAAVSKRLDEALGPVPAPPAAPRGVYLHGGVGTGKTLLADMFFAAAAECEALPNRRRLHCNEALLELHSRIHGLQAAAGAAGGDPAKHARLARMVQRRLARERLMTSTNAFERALAAANSRVMLAAARGLLRGGGPAAPAGPSSAGAALLCFDEMQTTDPFNVAALKALTEAALADGGALVATSNRAPRQLSAHGLHEAMFEHFVGALEGGCDVVEVAAGVDYRRQAPSTKQTPGGAGPSSYFYPAGPAASAALEAAWAALPGAPEDPAPPPVPVLFGRRLAVPRRRGGAAWFPFAELCARPLGPADFVALAGAFHTVFLSDVPALSMKSRDQARRFITLVDEVYNRRGRLVVSAAAPLDGLFSAEGEEPLVDLEGLQFEGAAEGAGLRRDVGAAGGVAPVAASVQRVAALGGEEERFAFARAVSRLHEMQNPEGAYARMHQAVWGNR